MSELTNEQIEFLTLAAKNHLLNFCETVNPAYESQWFHERIADALEDALMCAVNKKKKRIILSVPPRHGKSQEASIYFPAWALGKYPWLKFIVSTYGAELAEKNGKETRDLIASDAYKMIFPNVTLMQDMKARANWLVEHKDEKNVVSTRKGQYYAVGVGGAVTGYGADCFTGDTLVYTDEGYKRIDSLDLLQRKVLSFNHETNKLEWKRVLASSKRDLRKTIRITTSVGDSFRCTADHRIFTKQRGYIRADSLQQGEELIGIQGPKKSICTGEVFSLSERILKEKIRVREMVQEKLKGLVLFGRLFKKTSCCKKQEEVCNLWSSCYKENKKILREKRMQRELKKTQRERVSYLSYCIYSIKSSYKDMFKNMQSRFTFNDYVWQKKSELQARNGDGCISCRVLQNEEKSSSKGWSGVFNMFFRERNNLSSHRPQSKKQCDGELNNSLQELPLETPCQQSITVSSIDRDCEIENVYDIQVEDNHNFFANGALVHNCIIIDDPHKDRAEAESETMRKAVWDYYRSTLYSRKEGEGVIIVIMQRWRQDDLVGLLMEEDERLREAGEQTEDWEIISLPAIAEEDEYYRGELVRKEGESLWPSKFPLNVLESIKQLSPYYWASQYQQNPILAETAEFKKDMFQYYTQEDIKYKNLRYYTLVDPAISQKKSADNAVVLTVAKEIGGPNMYRIREDAGKYTPQQLVDLIFLHNHEYKSDVWIETIAYQEALKYIVKERQVKDQKYFVIHEIKSRSAKETRIRGLLGLYQNKVIWHLAGKDVNYELELLAFPKGRRDDRADCMAFMLTALEDYPSSGMAAKQYKPKWNGYGRKL